MVRTRHNSAQLEQGTDILTTLWLNRFIFEDSSFSVHVPVSYFDFNGERSRRRNETGGMRES